MGDIIKYGLLAVGGYLLYEYFFGVVAPTAAASATTIPSNSVSNSGQPGVTQNTGGSATNTELGPGNDIVPPTSTPSISLVSTSFQDQLSALANAYVTQNGGTGLNVDQWNYYMMQLTGVTLSGAQGEQIIQALGLTDATRGTIITMSQYLAALANTGLGRVGYGMVRSLQGLGLLVSY